MTLWPVYGDWRLYNELAVEALRRMSAEELSLRAPSDDPASSTSWPIWAIAGHTAAARVYWLCSVIGLPGAKATPFSDPSAGGWEDELDRPRSAEELVTAWTTTWAVVERALSAWTPDVLDASVGEHGPHLTRRSVLLRLMTHEAYHVGEIAVVQAIHGRPPIDLWPPGYHTIEAAAARRHHDLPVGGALG